MKQIKLTKKASTTVVLSVIIGSIIAGAIVTGTLLARNRKNNDYITFQEAIDIASAIPEVAAFIEENDINSVSANRYEEKWIVEFFDDNFNYTEDVYCWMNYAYVEIDALTGEILYYEVFNPSEPNYIEQEIIAIANAIPEIVFWIENQGGDITISAWYDGYELWYVDYWSDAIRTYPFVIISNRNGSVVYYEIYDPLENANHTTEEIIEIVESLGIVQTWITNNPEYGRDINYYDTIWFGNCSLQSSLGLAKTNLVEVNYINLTGGIWIVDYWALDNPYDNWLSVTIDDETGEVAEIRQSLIPTLTEQEAIAIAESQPEVSAFLAGLTSYSINVWFDSFYGYWNVFFENDFNYQEYATVDIIDATGEIFYYYINDLPDPNLTGEEALTIALAEQEVQDWISTISEYETYIGFFEGLWNVDFVIDNRTLADGLIPQDGIIGISVIIDDATEEVVEVNYIIMEEIS